MEIKGINDIVEIKDNYDHTYAFDPYMFQSLEIRQIRDNRVVLYIRWGNICSEAGYADCFCCQTEFKNSSEANNAKEKLYEVLNFCKIHQRAMRGL